MQISVFKSFKLNQISLIEMQIFVFETHISLFMNLVIVDFYFQQIINISLLMIVVMLDV